MESTSSTISNDDHTSIEQITYSQGSTIAAFEDENVPLLSTQSMISVEEISERSEDTSDEQPSKKPKLDETVDDEGSLCVICYEVWGQTGDHRVTALKCGHLFGHKCILRWLNENKVCPSCKKTAKKKDIRFIYANKLIALDNGELTRMQTELEATKAENINLQIEVTSVMCKLAMVNAEIDKYKLQLAQCMSRNAIEPEPVKSFQLKYSDSHLVCSQGSCRVMDYLSNKSCLVASMKSANNLFPGFGVRQFNCDTFAPLSYSPLHSKAIRDIKFNQQNNRMLSVSLDKHVSVSNIFSSETYIKQNCDDMLWSCCWDSGNSNMFYVGGQQGCVKIYDCRNMSDLIASYSIDGDMSPIVSIVSIAPSPGSYMPRGGFVLCKLNSLWAFENGSTQVNSYALPIEGPFISMTYSDETKQFLVSARPNAREPTARNILCNLTKSANVITCNRIHTFTSGKMQKQLSRSCFLSVDGTNYVATPNDTNVQIWNPTTGSPVASSRTGAAIIDLMPMETKADSFLLALSEKKFLAFNFIDT